MKFSSNDLLAFVRLLAQCDFNPLVAPARYAYEGADPDAQIAYVGDNDGDEAWVPLLSNLGVAPPETGFDVLLSGTRCELHWADDDLNPVCVMFELDAMAV